jgi:hypothetical protein
MSSAAPAAVPRRFSVPAGVDQREVARELERIDAHVRRDADEGRVPAYLQSPHQPKPQQPKPNAGGPSSVPAQQPQHASTVRGGSNASGHLPEAPVAAAHSAQPNAANAAPKPHTAKPTDAANHADQAAPLEVDDSNDFSLTSDIFLRLLGVAYFWAFASALCQLQALQGSTGLDPAYALLARVTTSITGKTDVSSADIPVMTLIDRFPSLLWPLQRAGVPLDWALHAVCIVGLVVAALQSMGCRLRGFAALTLFACYHTLTSCGGQFYTFQWDALLLELGFHAAFLQPRASRPTTAVGVWLLRFVWFRYNFANGVVKLTADCPKWLSLRALRVHFWTQPLPTPLAWYAGCFLCLSGCRLLVFCFVCMLAFFKMYLCICMLDHQ